MLIGCSSRSSSALPTCLSAHCCAWCIGGLANLWEWAANPWCATFVMLQRKCSGGGDYGAGPTHVISRGDASDPETLVKAIQAGVAREGDRSPPGDSTVGRWAGDPTQISQPCLRAEVKSTDACKRFQFETSVAPMQRIAMCQACLAQLHRPMC